MQLAFSELIFQVDSFLEGPWHWDWSGASRVWRREGLRSAEHSHLPCTEMAWQIRYPERCSAGVSGEVRTEQCHTAVFSWLYPATAIRRKAFGPVLKKMTALGLQPFLIYPAVIKLRHNGNREATIPLRKRRILSAPCLSRSRMPQLCGGTAGEQRPLFFQFGGRGVTAGMDLALAAQKGMIAGWPWMLAKPMFAFSSLLLGYCPYLSGTTISLLVRLTLHFSLLEGTNGE